MICEVSYSELLLAFSSAAFSLFCSPSHLLPLKSFIVTYSSRLNLERGVPITLMKGTFVDVKCESKSCLMT